MHVQENGIARVNSNYAIFIFTRGRDRTPLFRRAHEIFHTPCISTCQIRSPKVECHLLAHIRDNGSSTIFLQASTSRTCYYLTPKEIANILGEIMQTKRNIHTHHTLKRVHPIAIPLNALKNVFLQNWGQARLSKCQLLIDEFPIISKRI